MNNINKILKNIMTEALRKAEGKDKELIEEAMNTLDKLDAIPETEPSPRQTVDEIMNKFAEDIEKIKDR